MIVSLYKIALGFLILMVLGLTAIGQAGLLELAFPLFALSIGVLALRTSPTRDYVQFTMLLWMFAPLVRRLTDWQGGRHALSLVLLAPLLVTLLSFLVLPKRWPRHQAAILNSFLLFLVVVVWGAIMGVLHGQAFGAIYGLVTWIVPIGFAMLILSRSDRIDEISSTMTNVIVFGGATMAIYGIAQFALAPPWDTAWILSSEMLSLGTQPYRIRVFSTMNSPGVFALALVSALLAIFNRPSPKFLLAGIPIVLTLGLTLVRSAWGMLVLALLMLVLVGQARVRFRVILASVVLFVIAAPLIVQSEFFTIVTDRADSLWSLESDRSFEVRASIASSLLSDIPGLAIGHGLGASGLASGLSGSEDTFETLDNGFLDILFTYGIVGLVMLAILAFWGVSLVKAARARPIYAATAIVPLACFSQLMIVNVLYSPSGMFLFPFLAIALASRSAKSLPKLPKIDK